MASISTARMIGAPISHRYAYPRDSATVVRDAARLPSLSRRNSQKTTNARMPTFIPETTRMWYTPVRWKFVLVSRPM